MKKRNLTTLPVTSEGYTGLMGAKETIGKQLRKMSVPGIPIKYREHTSETESVFVFIANGICATLSIQKLSNVMEGGSI